MRALTLAAVLLVPGCVKADLMRIGPPWPPTAPEHVEVFVEEPRHPYTTIAIVEVAADVSLNKLKRKLIQSAARAGGDAIILSQSTTQPGGAVVVPAGPLALVIPTNEKKLTGKVIRFKRAPWFAPTPTTTPAPANME